MHMGRPRACSGSSRAARRGERQQANADSAEQPPPNCIPITCFQLHATHRYHVPTAELPGFALQGWAPRRRRAGSAGAGRRREAVVANYEPLIMLVQLGCVALRSPSPVQGRGEKAAWPECGTQPTCTHLYE